MAVYLDNNNVNLIHKALTNNSIHSESIKGNEQSHGDSPQQLINKTVPECM